MRFSVIIEPRKGVGNRVPDDLLLYVKSKERIKISHLCLATLMLLTRTVKNYPFSAGGWVCKELSFLFL